jgi:RNA polymerase sigma factor (sigma-70 family)
VAQTNDNDALAANAKHDNGGGSARVGVDLPKPVLADPYLHKEITALIPRLRRWTRVLTRDVIAADDLLQDCLTRALEKTHLWTPGTDLRAWLFTMLYRQHVSQIRRQLRHDHVEIHESHPNLLRPPNQPARLELRDVQRALAKLPEEQRSVILLIGLEGMGYEEAASVVNIPVGTVRSRVARGRESLRKVTGLFPGRHPTRRKGVTSGALRRVPLASSACS